MKHKFLFALALTSVLSFGAVSLASCGNEEIQDTTRYKVNYTANDAIYKVEGLKSDGYLEGEKVEFTVSIVDTNYELNSVLKDGVALLKNGDNYTFTMGNKDVSIEVKTTLKDEPEKPIEETSIFDDPNPGENKTYPETLPDFTPTLFKEDTLKVASEETLGDGVNHLMYTFNLNNDHQVAAHIIEVDLTKASLESNYSETGIATPYDQMLDYEEKSSKKAMAIVNADFFATGVGTSVNAYANDNIVIKASHNDNGIYDHKQAGADVPASMPMLIGISGDTAKISPIIQSENKEEVIKSKLSNILVYLDESGKEVELADKVITNQSELTDANNYLLITENQRVSLKKDQQIIKVKYENNDSVITNGLVSQVSNQKLDGNKTINDCDEYFYVISNETLEIKTGTKLGFSVTSADETFKYYSTIIGGRQSLVENGEIAPTVTEENTNGAQTTNIPRTSIGVIDEHNIILCSIESLRYNSKNNVKETDPYGVDLPELAEFLRYIGCYDAMNFDGGGSTQLITKNDNGNGEPKVVVRSSDYGTYELEDSRKVYSTALISTK